MFEVFPNAKVEEIFKLLESQTCPFKLVNNTSFGQDYFKY